MSKENELDLKGVYRLWWDYLKTSKNHEKLCQWYYQDLKKDPKKKPPKELLAKKGKGWHPFFKGMRLKFSGPGLNRSYQGFQRFGDVINMPFKDWWEKKKDSLVPRFLRSNWPGIIDLLRDSKTNLKTIVENAIEHFEMDYGKKPSIDEFKDYFPQMWANHGRFAFLMVDLLKKERLDNLRGDFSKIVTGKKKEIKFKQLTLKRNAWQFPTTDLQPKELESLEKYLTNYNHQEVERKKVERDFGLYYPEIEKKLSDKSISSEDHDKFLDRKESKIRLLRRDISIARKIIKNVEKGLFPGKYRK